ncbi:MAG: diacylglycerol kinase family protein [Lachnospiraceae bacterium]|nr:diacylglycerol kinase family protein [Ruminococcus sp.]MCM1274051.1 diacylglycerol kinase family protein [Lachnospiraceae bacterium]
MTYVLYNPLADNGSGKKNAEGICGLLPSEEIVFLDVTGINAAEFLEGASPDDRVILSGGDGTIHCLVNRAKGEIKHPLYYYPTGSGNDFTTDIRAADKDELILLDPYIRALPTVKVNGKTLLFLNGIGYGIDGYCCEEGDKLRKKTDKPINYAAIAVKGLLFRFKPRAATIVVDGVKREYEHVWLAATMNGRFYGGGMNVAPSQDRLNAERSVTVIVMHCPNKFKTLMAFPSIFKGEHVLKKDIVDVLTGHEVTVAFDSPTPLQVDGETFTGVSGYSVSSAGAHGTAEAAGTAERSFS